MNSGNKLPHDPVGMCKYEKPVDKPAKDSSAFDAYKLEYEQAAARYENIFKAVWQNFSYMAIVSGTILTFGKDALGVWFAAFLACLPFLFWYWATFEPLNRYGDEVIARLEDIEKNITSTLSLTPPMGQYTAFRALARHQSLANVEDTYSTYRNWVCGIAFVSTFFLGIVLSWHYFPQKPLLLGTLAFTSLVLSIVASYIFHKVLSQIKPVRARYIIRICSIIVHFTALALSILVVATQLFKMDIVQLMNSKPH